MVVLKAAQVSEGMELAEPVANIHGAILFRAGTVLTAKHIKAFKAWGITDLTVVSDNFESSDSVGAQTVAAAETPSDDNDIEREVKFIFQKTDLQDTVIQELYRLSLKARSSKLQEV